MSVGILILRVVVGLLFIGHGTQKLFGWFGGAGPEGTAGFLGSLGYRAPAQMALIGGMTETLGGALLTLGLLTPLGSALIVGMMVSAILVVHLRNGMWNENRGMELPLVYVTAAIAIAFDPGRYSIDRAIGLTWNSLAGVVSLGVGVFAALLVTIAMHRAPAPSDQRRPGAEERRRAA